MTLADGATCIACFAPEGVGPPVTERLLSALGSRPSRQAVEAVRTLAAQ